MTSQNWKDKAAALAKENNHVEETHFEAYLPPEGTSPARLVEYVEYGKQKKEFKGTVKYVPMVRLGFELLGEDYIRKDNDGTRIPNIIRTPLLTISNDVRASFKQLFLSMAGSNTGITSMYDMLFEPFMIEIVHNKSKDGKKTYANMKNKQGWTISPAVYKNPNNGFKLEAIPVESATLSEPLIFSFNSPTKEDWDKLFIDGNRDDGSSKNFIQEQIVGASNFDGSELQMMLQNMNIIIDKADIDLNDVDDVEEEHNVQEEAPKEVDKVAKVSKAKKLPAVPAEAKAEVVVASLTPEQLAFLQQNGYDIPK